MSSYKSIDHTVVFPTETCLRELDMNVHVVPLLLAAVMPSRRHSRFPELTPNTNKPSFETYEGQNN
jgi:hypothetical protein